MKKVLLSLAIAFSAVVNSHYALAQVFTMNASAREEAYRWLVRLSVDVEMVRAVAKEAMAQGKEKLQPDLLYHDKWMVNEWFLKPAVDELFAGDKRALKEILNRLDQGTNGFEFQDKRIRFSRILDFIDKLKSTSQVDFGKPSQSAKQKAYRQLFERQTKELSEVIEVALRALDGFVVEKDQIISEEKGYLNHTKSHDANHCVTLITLLRLEGDLGRMREQVLAEKQSQSISLGSSVLEYRTRGTNSWYVQQHYLEGLGGLRHTLRKRLDDMDSQSTGVFIEGKAHRYSDLIKLIDRLGKRLERDFDNPDRSEMKKAIDELVKRIDITCSLAKSLREKLPTVNKVESVSEQPELGFDSLNMMAND